MPPEYPIKPPKLKFDTKIWHPNINSKDGTVTLHILDHEWNSTLSIKTALLSLHSLLITPVFDVTMNDARNIEAASKYQNDKEQFNREAKDWLEDYAMDSGHSHRNIISEFFHSFYDFVKFLFDQRNELIDYETHGLIKMEPELVKWQISSYIKRIIAFAITISILIIVLIHSINKRGTLKQQTLKV